MRNHNICFCGEIRKIFTGYPPLSRPMLNMLNIDISIQCSLLQIRHYFQPKNINNFLIKTYVVGTY